ncbi:hypothetical protein [Candidatus Amarolinea dominans]|uniref:hypothetical protein n=1 Tax=Candidatus Amarolinea dominans TaxID=3140696 RepID=UPI0031CC42D7
MDRASFIDMLSTAKMTDLTQGCSIFTPPWPGEKSLEIHFFKRVTGAYGGGQGANGQILNWSNTVGTHLVGERAFHSGRPRHRRHFLARPVRPRRRRRHFRPGFRLQPLHA